MTLLVATFLWSPLSHWIDGLSHPPAVGKIRVERFNDYNKVHLDHARKNGIQIQKTNKAFREKLPGLISDGKLRKVTNTKYYVVDRLTHSHPYLTPGAVKLLNDIGKRFREKQFENGLGKSSFIISSLLRTEESQRGLSRSNVNASNHSSHCYGTTFDIPYSHVVRKPLPWMRIEVSDARAIKLLSDAIGELRNEGRCVVVTEKKEKCFHITFVK
ncbi:MAG TPA: DUF5715 family protein [Prolixibacteraceae bacterium]|nr:DUF5715 family protein [Prolixibacteraceae bacterium]